MTRSTDDSLWFLPGGGKHWLADVEPPALQLKIGCLADGVGTVISGCGQDRAPNGY